MTLPEQITSNAESIVKTLKETYYQHLEHILPLLGVYDCDCNGFVGFVLETVAPANYKLVPKEEAQPRPRAFKYYEYFASLTPQASGGWRRIDFLKDARAGDIVAWRFPTLEADENTGHVLIVAGTPAADPSGIYSVLVCDSAATPHFDDTRGSEAGHFPTGVGRGVIHFKVDAEGRPIAFQFAPPSTAAFEYLEIAIGRVEPILATVEGTAAADSTNSVLANLKPGSPLQPLINATLNAALKTQLVDAATAAKLPVLLGLINTIPTADLVGSKDLSLQEFVQQQIDPLVGSDPVMKAAIDSEIAKLPLTGTVSTALNLTSPLTTHPLLKSIASGAPIISLLTASPAINTDLQARFVSLYEANTGSISDFWTKLASDPQLGPVVPQLQLTLQLGTLTANNPDLVTKLLAQFKPSNLRDLTKVSTAQLVQLMAADNIQVPASIATTTTPASISQYADSMVGLLKQAFPTDYVAQSFSTSTDATNQQVAAFLNKSPDFDFATTHVDKYLAANPAALAAVTTDQRTTLTDRLKVAQRLFRVNNDGDVMQSLMGEGLDSAYAIASKTSGTFVANYATVVGGQDQAEQIHANATSITATANLIIRQAQENSSGVMSRVIQSSKHNSALDDALPNWKELFGTTSTCKCCECRAIDGPAAYFVSLLQFLRGLGKNANKNTPLDVLIGTASSKHGNVTNPRREDLAHLKLNCANADTALPYVDLVNEILENYIANGHVSDVNMNNTLADATTAVLDVTPEYTQTPNAVKAYNDLNAGSIVYPHTLPFDRYLETARIYLNSLNVSLYRLMLAFGTPAPVLQTAMQLAAEYLTMSLPEYELITDQDFAGYGTSISIALASYFGYDASSTPLTWIPSICKVPTLLSRTGFPFAELVTLLGTNYLNPEHLNSQKAVSLNIPADACDTTSMVLQIPAETSASGSIPTVPFLSPLPAFLRLRRKLGWKISELDYALRAFGYVNSPAASSAIGSKSRQLVSHPVGGGTGTGTVADQNDRAPIFIPSDFIPIAAQIQQLTQTLNLSVSDVVSLFADIDTDGRSSPFITLFQNKAVVNPPDSGLRLLYEVPLSAAPAKTIPTIIPDGASLLNTGSELNCVAYDSDTHQLTFMGSMTESQRDTLLSWANSASGSVQEDTEIAVQLLYSQRWYDGIQIAPTVPVFVGRFDPFVPAGPVHPLGARGLFVTGQTGSFRLETDLVDNHVNVILAALKIGASDLASIRNDVGSSSTDRLSIANLSAFHRYAILAQSLGLSIPDLITLKNLTGLQPFVLASGANGPKTDPMVKFVAAAQQVIASQFTVPQLAYLYGQIAARTGSLAPLQSTQDAVMATILVGLQNIAAANAFAPDPQGTSLRKKLAVLLASTPLQLDPTMALIGGIAVYTSQIQQAYPPALPTLPTLPAPGAQVTYVTTATVAGSITEGDSLILQVTSSAISASPNSVSYQVQATDTYESIAAALAAQVNLSTALIVAGISAAVSGAAITLAAPPAMTPAPVWAFNPPSAGSISETVTLAGSLVCAGPMTDATSSALSSLAGASAPFKLAVQDLYNQAQDILTNNLGFLAAPGPYSVSLTGPPPNIALPSGPVSFVPTVTVGMGSNQPALTVTPSDGSPVQVQANIAGTDLVAAAASLTTQMNANANLIAAGISATVSGSTISLVVEPSSTPSQTWAATVIPGPPSSTGATSTLTIGTVIVVAPSDQVSYSATATVGGTLNPDGTMNPGDTLSLTMTPTSGSAPQPVTSVIQPGDTPAMAATCLANNINAALGSANNISAAASGTVITISGPSTQSPLPTLTASPSSNLTIGCNLVSTVPMLNSTRTNLIGLAPSLTTAVKSLYQAAWGTPISNLIDNLQGWTAADLYDYVLQGLLTSLTNTQSRNLVKQTLAQALTLDPAVVDLLLEGTPALGVPTGLLPSSFTPGQSAMSDFLGGLNTSTPQQWTAKLLIPTTGAYNFAFLVNGAPTTSAQSSLIIGGQPITLYAQGGSIVPINLTAGQIYSVSVNAPAGATVSWRIAPAPLTTLTPIPNLAFMPCDGNWSYPNLALLYRLAVLINGFSMAAEDVAYFSTHGADFAGTDPETGNGVTFSLAGLSASATLDAPALFNQWQRLNALYTLKGSLPNSNTTLFDVFAVAAAPGASLSSVSPSVVQEITEATGWNPADISTLTASSGAFNFVDANFRNEMSLVQMANCISIGATTGISGKQLLSWANPSPATAPTSPFQAIAQDIQHSVKAKYDQPTWLQVGKPLNDQIRESTKEALINYILYLMPNPAYSTVDDLYGFFLIDVEMCTCMETSRLVQASAAVQLFVQRCLLNLESQNPDVALQISPSALSQQDVTEWNQWRKNYRVWQAAVEVFLYPENWIIPELRSNQTPLFEDLVTTLLQGEVNETNAEAAFMGYLQSLQQVARLEIVGFYVDNDTVAKTKITHVVARTFGTPYAYFYRTLDNVAYSWSPWTQINVDIGGDTIVPVIWNRRLFLFWPIYTEVTDPTQNVPSSQGIVTQPSGSGTATTAPPAQLSIKTLNIQLACSEYKNESWTSKQVTAESLAPTLYGRYSWTLDQSTFVYSANTTSDNGVKIVIFTPMRAIAVQAQAALESVTAALRSLGPDQPQNSGDLKQGSGARSNVAQLVSNVNDITVLFFQFPNVNLNSLEQMANDLGQITSTMNSNNDLGTSDVISVEENATSAENILANLTQANLICPIGSFFFDGSQGDATLNYEPPVAGSFLKQYADVAGLYSAVGWGFSYQSILQIFNGPISFAFLNGTGTNAGLETLLAPHEQNILSASITYAQQFLPPYAFNTKHQPFENAAFYTDQRRTYLAISAETGFQKTVVRDASRAAPPGYVTVGQVYFFNHYQPWVGELIKRLNWAGRGISYLLGPETQVLDAATQPSGQSKFEFKSYYKPTSIVARPYPDEVMDFGPTQKLLAAEQASDYSNPDYGTPAGDFAYAAYNWEVFFHIPLLIATQLSQNQQFEDAEIWFRYIFNPTNDPNATPLKGYKGGRHSYWNFLPLNAVPQDQLLGKLLRATNGSTKALLDAQIHAWQQTPFEPDVIAQLRPVAYQKTVVMKYLDHLIGWGDYCFGQNTRESINEAIQYYILADQILGKKPVEISQPGLVMDQTYWDLITEKNPKDRLTNPGNVGALGNANVALENAFPFVVSGTISSSGKPTGTTLLPTTPYFCTPDNPTLLGYYDTVADRLYKIRHCMNIHGQVEQLALFAPPINPALLVAAEAAGVDLSSVLNDINAAVPHYRFTTMMAKALELCAEVRSLGGALLSNLEKADVEGLALLRAGQELAVQQAVLQVKQLQVQESNANLAGLQATLAVTTARQTYYQGLIQGGLSSYEIAQVTAMALSEEFKIIAQVSGTEAAAGFAIPQIDIGINGVFGTPSTHVTFGGVQIAGASSEISKAFSMLGDMASVVASMAGLSGGWDRRKAEWQFQLETATLEIAQIQQQVSAANFRVQIATQDVNNQNLLIANASAMRSTLQSKFTNQDLYQWMVGQVSAVFFQCYQMAYDLAKRAEACYRFELGVPQSSYIQFGYWDSLKKGLLAGEKLFQNLKRLEVAYLDQNLREYEISKSISLLLLDPSAFVTLKLTGSCLINLPEAYFDMDYPGHYMRRIRSVSITMPCVSGPYTSVNCTLTLLQSRIRLDNSLPSGSTYAEKPVGSDKRFAYNFSATESIATSTAQNDSGLFEVNFRDERYLPFEGAGVTSQWRLDMPQDCNAFDFETITDLIINLRYSARNGGDSLRTAAKKAAVLPSATIQSPAQTPAPIAAQNSLQRYFSLRHEYPTEWYKLMNPPVSAAGTAGPRTMQIDLGKERFPFQYRSSQQITITEAQFITVSYGQSSGVQPPAPSIAGSGNLAQTAKAVTSSALGNATVFPIQTPLPQPSAPAQGGPKSWTLTYASTLTNVADIILICTYSVPSRQ